MQIVVRKYTDSFELFIQDEKFYEDQISRLNEILRLFYALDIECIFAFKDIPNFEVSDL